MKHPLLFLFLIIDFSVFGQGQNSVTHDTLQPPMALLYSNGMVLAEDGFDWQRSHYNSIIDERYSFDALTPEGMSTAEFKLRAASEQKRAVDYMNEEQRAEYKAYQVLENIADRSFERMRKGRYRAAEFSFVNNYKQLQDFEDTKSFLNNSRDRTGSADEQLGSVAGAIFGELAKKKLGQENQLDDLEQMVSMNTEVVITRPIDTAYLVPMRMHANTIAIDGLALLVGSRGRYHTADTLATKAAELRRNWFGSEHYTQAISLNNLAAIYRGQGRWLEAEEAINKALVQVQQHYGPTSYQYAVALNNAAMIDAGLGRFDDALYKLRQAQQLRNSFPSDEEELDLKRMALNEALIRQAKGQYSEAESIYSNWLNRLDKRKYRKHPDYALLELDMAALYMKMDRYEAIPDLLDDASQILDKRLNKRNFKHPAWLQTQSLKAKLHLYLNQPDNALAVMEEILPEYEESLPELHTDRLAANQLTAIAHWRTGDTKAAYKLFEEVNKNTLKLVAEQFPAMSDNEKEKFWRITRPRVQTFFAFAASVADAQPEVLTDAYELHMATKGLLLHSSTRTRETILASSDTALVRKYNKWLGAKEELAFVYTLSTEELREEKIELRELEEEVNQMERELLSASSLFKSAQRSVPKFEQVQSVLLTGEAAVEFVRYSGWPTVTDSSKVGYLALIATPSAKTPQAVVFENGKELEGKMFNFYSTAIKYQLPDTLSYDNFWAPVAESTVGTNTYFVSLDGVYNKLNINSLKLKNNYQLNEAQIVYLTNSRYLPEVKQQQSQAMHSKALLVGSPNYGSQGGIDPLPATAKEVDAIGQILKQKQIKYNKLKENEATEASIKQLEQVDLLHIATHGFFLSDAQADESGKVFGVSLAQAQQNPLLRSGLLLAGAGGTVAGAPERSGQNNGVLTAYEVMQLQLQPNTLVALSACETGLGEVQNGEGVYGLLRAFQLAGAESVIISLWKVDDAATQLLMTSFYQQYMQGKNRTEAFRIAQQKVKAKYEDPLYWGAFMLVSG